MEKKNQEPNNGLFLKKQLMKNWKIKITINSTITVLKCVNIKRDDKDGKRFCLPLAYAFMPNRTQASYNNLFYFLSKLYLDETGHELSPSRVTLDFERASINSVLYIWPETSVRLCSVHLQRSIRKKLQKLFGCYFADPTLLKLWQTLKSIHLVNWNHDLIETYFDYLESHVDEYGDKMTKFIKYLRDTYFKNRLKKGGYDPFSYKYWSWGQDIDTDDIQDTTSNSAEACNARLNRNVVTTYQKFSKSAQKIWEAHGEVLDEYARVYNNHRTPSRKRKKVTNQRWEFLSMSCEDFHNLYPESQIESLLNFLLKCSSKIPEPSESLEEDPQENETSDE